MADVEEQFEAAVSVIRSMPKKGTYQPSYETMLKFYGFYKQAKDGPCNESKPGFWDVVKKAKWDAWSSLGNISKHEAMRSYIKELKKVMESMPDTEEMAEFSTVLKSFYDAVYAPTSEEPPNILRIFKKLEPEKVKKCNGYVGSEELEECNNYTDDNDRFHVEIQHSDRNGLESNGHNLNNQENSTQYNEEATSIGLCCETQEDAAITVSNDLQVQQNGDLYIVQVSPQKKAKSKYLNGDSDVTHDKAFQSFNNNSESDDSDEEFCDSIGPEQAPIMNDNSDALNSTPDLHVQQDVEVTDNGNNRSDSEESNDYKNEKPYRLTSTPFHKKPIHVTFNTEEKTPSKKISVNGGILKVKQAGSGYGGGDAKQSSRYHGDRRYPQSRQQPSRLQDQTSNRGLSHSAMRASGHSDSDSDDTNPNCESCDSSGERDEINERIIIALERIQHDMNRVLRRLETMEDVMALRKEQHLISRLQREGQSPWWSQFLPSKAVTFLILWPFVINLIFYYLRRRKKV